MGEHAGRWEDVELDWSAENVLSHRQKIVALVGLGTISAALIMMPRLTVIGCVAVVVCLVVAAVLQRFVYLLRGIQALRMDTSSAVTVSSHDDELPTYTVIVAMYHEAAVVPALARHLAALDYPSRKIQFLITLEGDDLETCQAWDACLPPGWQLVIVPPGGPRTKPNALNRALTHATGTLTTIYDAEDRPDVGQLRAAAEAFRKASSDVAAFQARLQVDQQEQPLLTKLFAGEYAVLFGLTLRGIAARADPMPLGGTSTHFRTNVLRDADGWDAYNVTEDCELGMRLALLGYRCETLSSTTYEEATTTAAAWVRQRSRWVKGYAQTALIMLRAPLVTARRMGVLRYGSALLFVGGVPLALTSQVLLWVAFLSWCISAVLPAVGGWRDAVLDGTFETVTMTACALCSIGLLASQTLAIYQQRRLDLMRALLLLPCYWLLMCVAAWRGCLQLAFRPHYWEKTTHGLVVRGETVPNTTPAFASHHPQRGSDAHPIARRHLMFLYAGGSATALAVALLPPVGPLLTLTVLGLHVLFLALWLTTGRRSALMAMTVAVGFAALAGTGPAWWLAVVEALGLLVWATVRTGSSRRIQTPTRTRDAACS